MDYQNLKRGLCTPFLNYAARSFINKRINITLLTLQKYKRLFFKHAVPVFCNMLSCFWQAWSDYQTSWDVTPKSVGGHVSTKQTSKILNDVRTNWGIWASKEQCQEFMLWNLTMATCKICHRKKFWYTAASLETGLTDSRPWQLGLKEKYKHQEETWLWSWCALVMTCQCTSPSRQG